jgi:zeaxanthin glucosyltransferase
MEIARDPGSLLTWHPLGLQHATEVDLRIDVIVRPESGHVLPALPVMQALQRLGNEVRFVCLGQEAWQLTGDAGVERVKHFAPTVPGSADVPAHGRAGPLGMELTRRSWSVAQDWGELLVGAGAVLIDQTLPEVVLPALSRGLPVVILSTHLSYARRGATPPITVPDTDAERGWAMVSEGIARADRELVELVESGQLPPVMHPRFWQRWAAALELEDKLVDSCLSLLPGWRDLAELILVPEQLELPGHHSATGLFYLPPPRDVVKVSPVSRPVMKPPGARLALCAFGSQLQNYADAELVDRAQRCIDAVASLPDFFLALQAPDRLRSALRLTDRVEVRSTWPQRALLGETALFFTHCGVNSMLEAVRCGVAMVAQPLAWDQPGNAMRLEHHGLARCIRDTSVAGVAAVAREALALPRTRLETAASYFPSQAAYDARLGSLLPSLLDHACATHRR